MDDDDFEVTKKTTKNKSKKNTKRKRPSDNLKEPPKKKRASNDAGVPQWLLKLAQASAQSSDTSETEDSEEQSDEKPQRRSKRLAELESDLEEDSSEDEESDYEEYFEEDTTPIRESVVKHVLSQFTSGQRTALRGKVEKGVEQSFELMKELVNESMSVLTTKMPTNNMWKLGLGPREIKKYSPIIKELRQENKQQKITVKRILEAPVSKEQKRRFLGMFDVLQGMEDYSPEKHNLQVQLNTLLKAAQTSKFTPEQVEELSKKEVEIKKLIGIDTPLKMRILNADLDPERMAAIYEKYLLLEKTPDDSVTAASLEEWIEEALKTPYNKMLPAAPDTDSPGMCLVKLRNAFQKHLSDMDDTVLEPLLTVFNNRLHNPDGKSTVIGLLGSPGTGKTACGQVIAKAWGLPFHQISLGGVQDSSILDGQHSGWVGSAPGRFAKALQAMGVINGVLFLDEIDKLGETLHGLQVQYSLLHSIDPTQNDKFHDHYLGSKLPLNLSKTLIICALNKTDGIDPALLNRMHIIRVPDYKPPQKVRITMKHLFPHALKDAGMSDDDLHLTQEACEAMLKLVEKNVGKEGGMRGMKACIKLIVDKMGILLRTTTEEQEVLKLSFQFNPGERPVKITEEVVNRLYKSRELNDYWRHMYL